MLSVSICYEDIFPGRFACWWTAGRINRIPEAMFNLTDDSCMVIRSSPWNTWPLQAFGPLSIGGLLCGPRYRHFGNRRPAGRFTHRTGQWRKETLVGSDSNDAGPHCIRYAGGLDRLAVRDPCPSQYRQDVSIDRSPSWEQWDAWS